MPESPVPQFLPVVRLSEIGEQAFLQRIRKKLSQNSLPSASKFQICAPLGDDAFGFKFSSNCTKARECVFDTSCTLLCTTDTLVEETHFKLDWYSQWLKKGEIPQALAQKLVTANLSDLAAMGKAKPLFAFLTLGVNGDISVDFVDNLYTKILKLAKNYGFVVAGGDTIRAEKSILSLFLIGEISTGSLVHRKGAKIGDILMASGPLGLSSLGLRIMGNYSEGASLDRKFRTKEAEKLVYFHLFPSPKLREGGILADRDIMATSMMDTSDDLMSSLEILSKESGVGFELNLEEVPLHPLLVDFSRKLGVSPYEFFLYGGEDYQLLFTLSPERAGRVLKKIPSAYKIGSVRPKSFGVQVKLNGKAFSLRDKRFRHF